MSKPNSPAYGRMVAFINENQDILCALYDLDLLPEQVIKERKDATRKMCMMAFVWGYKLAKGLPMDEAPK